MISVAAAVIVGATALLFVTTGIAVVSVGEVSVAVEVAVVSICVTFVDSSDSEVSAV